MRRCSILALLLLLLSAAPAWAAPDLSGLGFTPHLNASLPLDAGFADEAGHGVRLRDVLAGRPALIAFGYYRCPTLCGVVRDDLFSALAGSGLRAGVDYHVVIASIDPAETPEVARQAKAQDIARYDVPGAEAGWRFLTGPSAALQDAVGFHARWDTALRQFLHPTGVVAVTPAGLVSSYVLGVGYGPQRLAQAVRLAAAGRVAAAPSPLLLLCFHYDAGTGRYTLAIEKVLSLMALLTVAGIGGMLLLLSRGRA